MKIQRFEEFINEQNGFLPSPTGNPSRLSKKLYYYVRSEEFIEWFGDWINDSQNSSKVVGDNGEPLLVYHGSYKDDINNFKPSYGSRESENKTIYFTNSKKNAKTYGKKLYSCFLNIRNMYDINAYGECYNDPHGERGYDIVMKAESVDTEEYDGSVVYNIIDVKEPTDKGESADDYIVFDSRQVKIMK